MCGCVLRGCAICVCLVCGCVLYGYVMHGMMRECVACECVVCWCVVRGLMCALVVCECGVCVRVMMCGCVPLTRPTCAAVVGTPDTEQSVCGVQTIRVPGRLSECLAQILHKVSSTDALIWGGDD